MPIYSQSKFIPLIAYTWRKSAYRVYVQMHMYKIQSTLVISKSKGPSEILRDIRTSTYQMCKTEENTNRTTKFHKWTCNLTPLVRNICWKYCGNGRNCSLGAILPLSTKFYYLMLDFCVKTGIRFSLRDKRLFEITEVEIMRVDCISIGVNPQYDA